MCWAQQELNHKSRELGSMILVSPFQPDLWFCDATSVADITSGSVTGLHHYVTFTWPIHTPSTVASLRDHGCSLAEGWHGLGKAQNAKLSQLFYFVTFQRQILLSHMWCERGHQVTRAKAAQGDWSVPGLCRSPSGKKPFSLSQSPVVSVLKTLEQFPVSYKGPLEVEPYGRKAHATSPYQLGNFKENFQVLFLFLWLVKIKWF